MSQDFGKPLSFGEIKEKTEKYILQTYNRQPVAFYFGQGETLYDTENREYIDFVCGVAVNALGHGEADIVEAIREQAERVIHTSNLYYNQEQALLAEVLIQHSYPGKVFFCNSGTEANEAAFKLARRHGQQKNGSTQILALEKSFHGRTAAGMTLTGQERIHQGFGPLIPDIKYIKPNDVDMLERAIFENPGGICALFLELVQGESGVLPLERDYVQTARRLTQENGILLIIDEIQTGIGRTGTLFASEQYGVEADAMTLAKALGSGFPIGAMIVREPFAKILGPGMHGSTFGGNHLAARVAYETIRVIMTRDILSNVNAISEYMLRRLRSMATWSKSVKDVRGLGLLLGVEFDRPAQPLVDACRDNGLLVNCTAQNTIRIMPPLVISLEKAAQGLDIFEAQVKKVMPEA